MKIKDLKEYLNGLPEELDNFDIVYSEVKTLVEEDSTWARLDMPVDSIVIDQDHEEMVMGKWETIEEMMKLSESEPTPVGLQTAKDSEPIPDGTYPCLWSGYNVEIKLQGKTYNLSTEPIGKGVRGMNCPATAVIVNGEITDVRDSKTMKNV